jgi:type I site-specific restriction endonuclease
MPSLADNIMAQTIAAGLDAMFGRKPMVYETGGRLVVGWRDTDAPAVSAVLERTFRKLSEQPTGPVQVDFAPVLVPAAVKLYGTKATLVSVGLVVVGVAAGYALAKHL